MSTEVRPSFEVTLKELLREVVREELQAISTEDKLLTAEHVAKMLDYTDVDSVLRLKKEGRLKGVYLSERGLRFYSSEVQKFIKNLPS